jgi:hypothetical protein
MVLVSLAPGHPFPGEDVAGRDFLIVLLNCSNLQIFIINARALGLGACVYRKPKSAGSCSSSPEIPYRVRRRRGQGMSSILL